VISAKIQCVVPFAEIIESDARRVFDDVIEEFVSIDDILKRFSEWRKTDRTAYIEAYANICLPKVLGPIIRMNMLLWNPLNRVSSLHLTTELPYCLFNLEAQVKIGLITGRRCANRKTKVDRTCNDICCRENRYRRNASSGSRSATRS